MAEAPMEDLSVEGTIAEVLVGWCRWKPKSIGDTKAHGGATVELAARPPARDLKIWAKLR